MTLTSALYVGRVHHQRFRPKRHRLSYRVFWMLLDLDEIATLAVRLRLFSRNRFNLYSFCDRDYGDRSARSLRDQIRDLLADAGILWDGGPVRLLTMPRIFGYAFNPLSTYFCYAVDGGLCATIYEVRNTFGEVHHYVAPAREGERPIRQRAAKTFHVSPFMRMAMTYNFQVEAPDQHVAIGIDGGDEAGRIISASLYGERRELTDTMLLNLLATHPLLTLKVTAGIHWHALRLLAKRVPWFAHPERT